MRLLIYRRRITPLLTMLAVIFLISGCKESNNENQISGQKEEVLNEVESVIKENAPVPALEIQVDPSGIHLSAIPEFVKITVANTSEELEYKGSYHYSVEYWDNENWIPVCCPAVPDEEVKISPGESAVFDYIQLNPKEYDYSVGKYRVNYNNCGFGEFLIIDE